MFRKISLPASIEMIGLTLLILALSLVTATLATAQENHRAFENQNSLGDEPTAPMHLDIQCSALPSAPQNSNEPPISASVTLQVTPQGTPVHAFVLSEDFGGCESRKLPDQNMAGSFETNTFLVDGKHCDSSQGLVVVTVSENRGSMGPRGKVVSLSVGQKNFSCRTVR